MLTHFGAFLYFFHRRIIRPTCAVMPYLSDSLESNHSFVGFCPIGLCKGNQNSYPRKIFLNISP